MSTSYNIFEFRNRMSDIITKIMHKETIIIQRDKKEFAAIIPIADYYKFLEYEENGKRSWIDPTTLANT